MCTSGLLGERTFQPKGTAETNKMGSAELEASREPREEWRVVIVK